MIATRKIMENISLTNCSPYQSDCRDRRGATIIRRNREENMLRLRSISSGMKHLYARHEHRPVEWKRPSKSRITSKE